MDLLQLREAEILNTIERLAEFKFVLIGGYAVNTYVLPRFSVDCDIVTEGKAETTEISRVLQELGYSKEEAPRSNTDLNFARYEKSLDNGYDVSVDLLIGEVTDRQTGASFSAGWVFQNSRIRQLRSKTIAKRLRVRIIDLDALVVMKMISCRETDVRDVFMLAPQITNVSWVREEISSRCDIMGRYNKLKDKILSKDFRNGLQGVYGLVDDVAFEKSMKAINSLAPPSSP